MESFKIGRVLSRSIELQRNSVTTVGLFVLFIALLEFSLSSSIDFAFDRGPGGSDDLLAKSWPISLAAYAMVWAGGLHGMLQIAFRGSTSIGECFQIGLARFFAVAILTLLWGLGVLFGYTLFIFPALILLSAWALAVPALIDENCGIIEAFSRSRDLTRGHRLVIFAVLFALLFSIMFVYGVTVGAAVNMGLDGDAEGGLLARALMLPATWLGGMLLLATIASLYVEARLANEGSLPGQIDKVFG